MGILDKLKGPHLHKVVCSDCGRDKFRQDHFLFAYKEKDKRKGPGYIGLIGAPAIERQMKCLVHFVCVECGSKSKDFGEKV